MEFKEELKRYLGILAEDFQHKLNFVIDAQEDIKRLIMTTNEQTKKELRAEFRLGLKETEDKLRAEFRSGLSGVEKEVSEVKSRLYKVEENIGEIKGRLDKLEIEMFDLKKEVSGIKAEVISHRDSTEIKQIKKKKRT